MARQASRAERVARADHVLDNSGSLDDLAAQVRDLWAQLRRMATPKGARA
jgi:dephospho-CoA kinase